MGKDRQPTPEEKRLWRDVTRHDEIYRAEPVEEEGAAVVHAPLERQASVIPEFLAAGRKRPAAPLPVVSGRMAARLLKSAPPIQATLDLHGLSRLDAYQKVHDFLRRVQGQGMRHVLIITGKGRTGEGVLRAQLPHWLNEPELRGIISGLAHPAANKGGSGVFHVVVKRLR